VAAKLAAALKGRQDGLPLAGDRQRVGEYLTNWLEGARPSLRPRTWERYAQYLRLHAIPEIGRLPLARLTPEHLQRLYAARQEAGLSAMSVRHLHAVLHRALEQATRWGLVARNVASLVSPPRAPRHEMHTLTTEQARAFLQATESDRFHALYVLAVSTGMRQGELLALRWQDVGLERGTVQVRASLEIGTRRIAEAKTAGSRRQVTLTRAAVEALRDHRTRQLEERLRSPYWDDLGLVFANEVGRPVEVGNLLRRSFRPLLEKAGLPRIRFHDLRHTAATLLLGRGLHPKIVSDLLGHARISTTLDLYSHVTPTMQAEAAAAMDVVLGT
jgi:integrase